MEKEKKKKVIIISVVVAVVVIAVIVGIFAFTNNSKNENVSDTTENTSLSSESSTVANEDSTNPANDEGLTNQNKNPNSSNEKTSSSKDTPEVSGLSKEQKEMFSELLSQIDKVKTEDKKETTTVKQSPPLSEKQQKKFAQNVFGELNKTPDKFDCKQAKTDLTSYTLRFYVNKNNYKGLDKDLCEFLKIYFQDYGKVNIRYQFTLEDGAAVLLIEVVNENDADFSNFVEE